MDDKLEEDNEIDARVSSHQPGRKLRVRWQVVRRQDIRRKDGKKRELLKREGR